MRLQGWSEERLEAWRDEYRKDAILGVSLCFRCSSEDVSFSSNHSLHGAHSDSCIADDVAARAGKEKKDVAAARAGGAALLQRADLRWDGGGGGAFLPAILAKLSSFISNSPAINVCLGAF